MAERSAKSLASWLPSLPMRDKDIEVQSVARKWKNLQQKAKGKAPSKFEFELRPYFAAELPSKVTRARFVCERGSKLQATAVEDVTPDTGEVRWTQELTQACVLYSDGIRYDPKEFYFKVQQPKGRNGTDFKTVAKVRVDLAERCSDATDSKPQELFFQLRPSGKLKMAFRANYLGEMRGDGSSGEGSLAMRSEGTSQTVDEQSQDLSGFDPGSTSDRSRDSSTSGSSSQPLNPARPQNIIAAAVTAVAKIGKGRGRKRTGSGSVPFRIPEGSEDANRDSDASPTSVSLQVASGAAQPLRVTPPPGGTKEASGGAGSQGYDPLAYRSEAVARAVRRARMQAMENSSGVSSSSGRTFWDIFVDIVFCGCWWRGRARRPSSSTYSS